MMETSKIQLLGWLTAPDLIPGLIERGVVEADEMVDITNEYEQFLVQLEKDWPSDRIKEYMLKHHRDEYQKTARTIQNVELENRDARVRGVSFKERRRNHEKIELGHMVLAQITKEANEVKRGKYAVRDYVSPLDMPAIQKEGFEKYIKYAIFRYPQVVSLPLALSPVKVYTEEVEA